MRVVHFGLADDAPGAARASYRLHRALVEQGVESRMVVAQKSTQDPTVTGPTTAVSRLRVRAAGAAELRAVRRLGSGGREISLGATGSGLLRVVRDAQADVTTLHWLGGGLVRPESLRKLGGRPVVWRLADMWPFNGREHYAGASRRYVDGFDDRWDLDRWVWSRKRAGVAGIPDLTVVAPSRWMAQCARESAMFRATRVEVIATGTDVGVYAPRDRGDARRELGLPEQGPLVLFGAVGAGTNPRKGAAELRAAVALLATSPAPRPRLVTFGDAPQDLRDAGLEVWGLGRLSDERDLARAYAAADVFVAPSVEENLANTVLEALACGTPVVAFDVGGMPDAITHEVNGWLAPLKDVGSLARGIEHFASGAGATAVTAGAAREAAEVRFNARRQAVLWKDLYEDVIANRRRRAGAGSPPRA